MNKPIIFYQFDQKQFFENHYQRGILMKNYLVLLQIMKMKLLI